MRTCFASLLVLVIVGQLFSQELKEEGNATTAKVVVVGKAQTFAGTIIINNERRGFAILELAGKTKISVRTDQDLAALDAKALDAKSAYQDAKLKEIDKIDDVDKKLEALDELLPRMEVFDYRVSEGVLSVTDKQVVMLDGKVRLYDLQGKDKHLPKGRTLIEGDVLRGKFEVGNSQTSSLAIRNGKFPIIVVGKPAEAAKAVKGLIRVTGTLSVNNGMSLIIQADKVEPVEK